MNPNYFVLALCIIGATLSIVCLLYSIFFPASRIWPIPSKNPMSIFFNKAVSFLTAVGFLCMGYLGFTDYGSLHLPQWFQLAGGAVLFVTGGGFGLAGFLTLSPEISTGTPGDLQANGPYRFSRNPQYVGAIVFLLGLGVIFNSSLVLISTLPWIVWFILAPFAEEPWLRAELGKAYEGYLLETRRYL